MNVANKDSGGPMQNTPTELAVVRPRTLNLQAIDLCNSRCIMCNIWKDGRQERMSLDEFRRELGHPFYSEVQHVGVTGGEPTLRKDLAALYKLLPQCLPKLAGASFITHGLQTERTVETYAKVHAFYLGHNLTFSGMVSLDGVGSVHDRVRGRPGAFAAASRTLLQLQARDVKTIAACTVVRSNVYGLHDLLDWGRSNDVYVRFRVAEFIRRLYNDSCANEIRGFSPHELRHLVSFFHVLLGEYETEETIRKTYHSILSLLTGGERLIGCPFQKGLAVNADSRGWLACCAPKADPFKPASDIGEIHSVLTAQRKEVARVHCASCIHDYHEDWNEITVKEIAGAKARCRELYEVAEEQLTTPEIPAGPFNLAGMKQILLAGWYGTETAGDIAILEGIINEYLAVNPQLRFQVLSLFPYYTRTTIALWPEALRSRVRVVDYAGEAAWQATLDCDAVVMAGGPLMDIADTRKILCLFKRFADLDKPRVIEGCGVGPLNNAEFRWNVIRIARLATRISVRDSASRETLRFYGLRKPIAVRLDPAVTFIRSQGIHHHGSEQKVIRCFLRELTCEYPQATTSAQAMSNIEMLLRHLLVWYPEHCIELWAMHHFPIGMDDRLFARQLVKEIGNSRITFDWEPRTPKEIITAMAAADFCVCMRFHSCVFASEVGVPFMAIDYTDGGKIKAFFDDIRQENRVCRLADLPVLDQDQFEAKLRLPAAAVVPSEITASVAPGNNPPRILHLIQHLIGGGGARAMISLARYSARLGGYEHQLASLAAADAVGLDLARQAGLPVLIQPGHAELQKAMAAADIVLVHWWNNPDLATLFRRELPAMRLATWIHVGGYHAPQVLTPSLIDFTDLSVACSPHTYAHPVFANLPEEMRQQRTAMVLAGAEFDRLQGLTPRAHEGFRVGYIGTVDPVKMHSEFVNMSCAVNVPEVKFIVCGNGDLDWLTEQAGKLGRSDSFDFRGHVEDIRSVLETLDVYGYPLCPETYAAAELNLQEAMFAGVPVVTFPHGGIGRLIQNGETGILVNTTEEYARAIERLHKNPAERSRLGANGAAFARRNWGAENAAREFNRHFARLLTQAKRTRQWGVPPDADISSLPPSMADQVSQLAIHPGARMFIESLGEGAQPFLESLTSSELKVAVEAEDRIAGLSRIMHDNGIFPYREAQPKDPFLQLWAGLGFFRSGKDKEAFDAFTKAWQNGFTHWRVQWYRALAAERAGQPAEAVGALNILFQVAPDFAPAREMQGRLGAFHLEPASKTSMLPVEAARNCVAHAERYWQAGELSIAREWLVRALDMVPRQLELMEAVTELDCRLGNLATARNGYEAIVALDPQRQSPALDKIQKALALNKENHGTGRPDSSPEVDTLVRTAKAALERGDCRPAISALQSAHEISPPRIGILMALGNLHFQAGDFLASVAALQQAASLAPAEPFVQVLLARAFVRLDRVQEFETALGHAMKIDPGFAPAHRLLGDLMLENGQLAGAAEHYRLMLSPSVSDTSLQLALDRCLKTFSAAEAADQYAALRLARANYAVRETLAFLDAIAPGSNPSASADMPAAAGLPVAILSEDTARPLVTAIVSTYNSERFMAACMEDVLAQTIQDKLEILVIDSGSQENEGAIVAKYQEKHANIRYVRTEREPLYVAWNRAVKLARGKYVVNANTDDSRRPDAFEVLLAAMEKYPDADLAYSYYGMTNKPNDQFPPTSVYRNVRHDPYHPAQLLFYCITGCLQFWRKTSLERIKGFDESLKCVADYEILIRFMRQGMKPILVPEPLSCFYINMQGLSFGSTTAAKEDAAIKDRYHGLVTAAEIYDVDPANSRELARAWVNLGNFAAAVPIPWDDHPHQYYTYAIQCYHQAMKCDESSEAAWHNLAVISNHLGLTEHFLKTFRNTRKDIAHINARAKANPTLIGFLLEPKVAGYVYQRERALSAPLPELGSRPKPATQGSVSAGAVSQGKISVAWEGSFLDFGSLSHVNRELTRALAASENVRLQCVNSPASKNGASPKALKTLAGTLAKKSSADTQITIRHAWPPDWQRPASGRLVVIQPWEFGALPEQWVKDSAQVDEFWVPSEYVHRVYVESGVPADKVVVVPNGVNLQAFHPQATAMKLATQKKFKLLFVGGTIFRKGPDLLLKAFLDNFTATDDVCLVIKDFGGETVYAGQTFESQIRAAQSQPNAPEILYLNGELPPDSLPGLYTACDCLVLPYRGEGFGLPVLEAMACGLPVIVTAGGATDDFVRDEFAWRIPSERWIFGHEVSGLKLAVAGWLLKPDGAALGRFMREAFANPVATRQRGQLAARHAGQFCSWQHSAAIVARRIRELVMPQPSGCAPERGLHTASVNEPKKPAKTKITLPPCALAGHLAGAGELVRQKKFRAAWEAVLAALVQRPFHPEAVLLLAEIAQITGDGQTAKRCAERSRQMAPDWKPAKKFLNQRMKGGTHPDWLKLPDQLRTPNSELPPRLSVCLIVKNEEKFLAQCLKSIRDLATQIVVVDTGSTDRTVAIAREHGAEVHAFVWCDDFSAARNAALEHATGDWVLMLDADEELSAAGREKLRRAMNDPAVMAWRLPMVDVGREAEGCSYVPRLYRNAPGLFYVGRVHEQVFSSLEVRRTEWGLQNRIGDATLIHHGYTAELTRDRNKAERNLQLLELAIGEMPDEPHLLMNLGLELARSGREPEALVRYLEAFDILSSRPATEIVPELRETLLMQLSARLMAAKKFDEVVRVLNSPLAGMNSGLTASLHFSLGLSHLELRRFREAADQMRQCLAKRNLRSLAPINKEINTAAPHHCLALCLAKSGDAAAAEKAFQDGLQETGHGDALRLDYASFLAGQNRPVDALQRLNEVVAANALHLGAWQLGGQIALSRPEFLEFARDWTAEAMRQVAADAVIIALRAEALMLSEDTAGALELWERVWNSMSQPAVLAALILCEAVESPTTHAPQEGQGETAASYAFIAWYQKLISVKAYKTIGRLNEQSDKLSRALPGAAKILAAALAEAKPAAIVGA